MFTGPEAADTTGRGVRIRRRRQGQPGVTTNVSGGSSARRRQAAASEETTALPNGNEGARRRPHLAHGTTLASRRRGLDHRAASHDSRLKNGGEATPLPPRGVLPKSFTSPERVSHTSDAMQVGTFDLLNSGLFYNKRKP